jgi:6-pyruvoyltetrahydropterin/6-carboxytetrahydropterin synthase
MTSAVGTPIPTTSPARVGSAADEGRYEIAKAFGASFSHKVPTPSGLLWCGHNCNVIVQLTGELDPKRGWVRDYGDLASVKPLLERTVDHHHLDETLLPGLPSSCDDTARQVGRFVQEQLAGDPASRRFAKLVCGVQVVDAWPDRSWSVWRSIERPITFHAHHRLLGLPEDHKCSRDHGHGYMEGFEIDRAVVGNVTDTLRPVEAFVRRDLNQRSLNEALDGLNPTAEHLAAFLGRHAIEKLGIQGIVRVVVAETPATTAVWRPPEYRQ